MPSRRQSLHLLSRIACHGVLVPVLRRAGACGRGNRCAGSGVTSSIESTLRPAVRERADGRLAARSGALDPHLDLAHALAHGRVAACSAARCAAKGVLLRVPLKPTLPAEPHEIVSPFGVVMVMCVLLKVAFTCATPRATFFLIFFLTVFGHGLLHPLHGLLPGDGLLAALARARVGPRALAAHGQAAAVAQAAVAADVAQAADAAGDLRAAAGPRPCTSSGCGWRGSSSCSSVRSRARMPVRGPSSSQTFSAVARPTP